jgi:hypothetical protein
MAVFIGQEKYLHYDEIKDECEREFYLALFLTEISMVMH